MTSISLMNLSRRQFIQTGALAAALPALPWMAVASAQATPAAAADPWHGLKVGVATYTLRELPIDEAIKGVKRVGLKYVSIKNVKNHIDLSHTSEERKHRAHAELKLEAKRDIDQHQDNREPKRDEAPGEEFLRHFRADHVDARKLYVRNELPDLRLDAFHNRIRIGARGLKPHRRAAGVGIILHLDIA